MGRSRDPGLVVGWHHPEESSPELSGCFLSRVGTLPQLPSDLDNLVQLGES